MLHHLITGNIRNSFIRHETVQKIFEKSSYSIKPFPDNNFRLQAYEFGGNIHKTIAKYIYRNLINQSKILK